MKVYVVQHYDDVVAVFSSKERCDAWGEQLKVRGASDYILLNYSCIEVELDALPKPGITFPRDLLEAV